MKYRIRKADEKKSLYSRNKIFTRVNNEFLKINGYSKKDIEGKLHNKLLEVILENMSDEVVVVSNNGKSATLNKAFRKNPLFNYVGLSDKESINKNISHVDKKGNIIPLEKLPLNRVLNGEVLSEYRMDVESNDTKIYREVSGTPVYDHEGNLVAGVIVGRDIAERLKREKFEETLKIKEEIFANVAHELKTPLNVIFSTNQLMEMYLKNSTCDFNRDKLIRSVEVIKQNCYRFTKLINNIVDFSKIESGFLKLNMSNENIVCLIEDMVDSVAEYIKQRNLNITFNTNVEEKIISCDPDKVERIILNLISNAIKFTNPGGHIFVDLIDKGNFVEIFVKDTGIGMDKEQLDKVFNRFHQVDKSLSRNTEGSGIGLSLVKSIVELLDGEISLKSKEGIGSTFKIKLPAKTLDSTNDICQLKPQGNKIEMMNIEFSDIYPLHNYEKVNINN